MNEVTKAVTAAAATRDPNAPMLQPNRKADVQKLLEDNAGELKKALPKHLTIERMLKVLVFCIDQNPDLLKCTQRSLFACVKQLAELGLEPGGVRGLAYLIPFKQGGADLNRVCTLIVGYKGLVHLARQSGFLHDIEARVVHEGDVFKCEFGLTPVLRHVPAETPGKPVKVYCLARLKSGQVHVEVMSWAEVMKIKARSRASGDGPWVTDEEQMARKTVIRRAANYLDLSPELAMALALADGEVVEGEVVRIDEITAPAAKPPKGLSEENHTETLDSSPLQASDAVPVGAPTVASTGPIPPLAQPTPDELAFRAEQERAEAALAQEEANRTRPTDVTPPAAPNEVDAWLKAVAATKTLNELKDVANKKPKPFPPERAKEADDFYKAQRTKVLA